MPKEPDIQVKWNVNIKHKKFIPDKNGKHVARDGTRGNYAPWTSQKVHNLLTTAGRDFLHQQGYETSGLGSNGGNYIALSSDTGTPAVGDTTLTGEITNLGLDRTQGTVAHTAGDTTSTISNEFTATGTQADIQKSALFTASSAGTMVHEATFNAVNVAANDLISVIWTITLS